MQNSSFLCCYRENVCLTCKRLSYWRITFQDSARVSSLPSLCQSPRRMTCLTSHHFYKQIVIELIRQEETWGGGWTEHPTPIPSLGVAGKMFGQSGKAMTCSCHDLGTVLFSRPVGSCWEDMWQYLQPESPSP